jgi:hypothetical protein
VSARQQIIDAGGEPREIGTLRDDRLTALWVSAPERTNFAWVRGASFTAHNRARMAAAAARRAPRSTAWGTLGHAC